MQLTLLLEPLLCLDVSFVHEITAVLKVTDFPLAPLLLVIELGQAVLDRAGFAPTLFLAHGGSGVRVRFLS